MGVVPRRKKGLSGRFCQGNPARQCGPDDGRPTRLALDLEATAKQPETLAHARNADTAFAVLGRHHARGVEAVAVVADFHADALGELVAKRHRDLAATAV